MMKRKVIIPVLTTVDQCYGCPYLYIKFCKALSAGVKIAVNSRTIDDRCPFLRMHDLTQNLQSEIDIEKVE